jgi:uncharacterized protein YgbK (DUF1537 family)
VSKLRISFYGDDFTGSTDAMESLARHGLRTILFTRPPTRQMLSRHPDLEAFGIAGTTRSMTPAQMRETLKPAFQALREIGAPIVHYKVCSTFDSSPQVGSIGCVIDLGMEIFKPRCVPVLVGAPALGRYCVFGNLFARFGADGEVFRLDRHSSMSRHPVTPMDEADLRVHLAKQTSKKIGLLDVRQLDEECEREFDRLIEAGNDVILIDLLREDQLPQAGRLIARRAPTFVVGSSGVEAALAAHSERPLQTFASSGEVGPILAACGSCSPVTSAQIKWAAGNGFKVFSLGRAGDAIAALRGGKSVIVHTDVGVRNESAPREIAAQLSRDVSEILSVVNIRRMIVAGGDTSGAIAAALGIESMEMIAELTRGSPLCRISAPGSPADGMEITFKGGQIGPTDFFGMVQKGQAS